jgi:hypothetical protein
MGRGIAVILAELWRPEDPNCLTDVTWSIPPFAKSYPERMPGPESMNRRTAYVL